MSNESLITRRAFLAGTVAVGSVGAGLWSWKHESSVIPGSIVGANHALGHKLREVMGQEPSRVETKDLVIVGGGIAGLSAAHRFSQSGKRDFVLLELDKEVGGNSGFGTNSISPYPWGAHYVPLLSPESTRVRKFFEEVGVIEGERKGLPIYNDYYLCAEPQERLFYRGQWQENLIPQLGLTATEKAQMDRFFALMEGFKKARGSDGRRAFVIPLDESSRDLKFLSLDNISMAKFMADEGFTADPLVWYVNYCCRDDFGTRLDETSAWAGIHYFAARIGHAANASNSHVVTWPEGNGFLVKALKERIAGEIRSHSLAFKIQRQGEGWRVSYLVSDGKAVVAIDSKAVVCATPRFVTARLVEDPGLKDTELLSQFTYSPWMVANISVSRLPKSSGVPVCWDNVRYQSESLGYIVATHQSLRISEQASVLTYYLPITDRSPKEGREYLLSRRHQDWTKDIQADLAIGHPELARSISHIDVMLWGHAMIRPKPGFIWGPARKRAAEPRPGLFFAHSDLSGMSIFEEAFYQGELAAEAAITWLGPSRGGTA